MGRNLRRVLEDECGGQFGSFGWVQGYLEVLRRENPLGAFRTLACVGLCSAELSIYLQTVLHQLALEYAQILKAARCEDGVPVLVQ